MPALLPLARTLVLFAAVWASASAQESIPSAPTQWVTDNTGFLSTATTRDLNDRLRSYERQTGHQLLVYVVPASASPPTDDWTVRAFASWKVGRKTLDDGLILFVFPKNQTLRIEVGYGLEAVVPDVVAARIIRETIAPGLRQGQPDRAIVAGVDRLLSTIGRTTPEQAATQQGDAAPAAVPLNPFELVLIGLALLALGLIAIRSPMTALFLLVNIFGRGGGGGMSGASGFSGGGGRSGGGGASGRW